MIPVLQAISILLKDPIDEVEDAINGVESPIPGDIPDDDIPDDDSMAGVQALIDGFSASDDEIDGFPISDEEIDGFDT